MNEKKMLIVLKSENYEPLSLYVQDFLQRYKPECLEIESRDDLVDFLTKTLPIVTHIKNEKLMMSS